PGGDEHRLEAGLTDGTKGVDAPVGDGPVAAQQGAVEVGGDEAWGHVSAVAGRRPQARRVIQPRASSATPYWMSRRAWRIERVISPPSAPAVEGADPPSQRSSPTGVTTAAVPQAKTSVMSPEATPSFHSSIPMR